MSILVIRTDLRYDIQAPFNITKLKISITTTQIKFYKYITYFINICNEALLSVEIRTASKLGQAEGEAEDFAGCRKQRQQRDCKPRCQHGAEATQTLR